MANGPKISKFETTDLASFYKNNGSEFSSIRPFPGQYDFSGKDINTDIDKTPVSKLAQMVEAVPLSNPTPEKIHTEVFPFPQSPEKIGIDTAGFLFSPAHIGTDTTQFNFSPGFIGTNTSTFDFLLPDHAAQLKIHNEIKDIDATGFTKSMTYPNTQFKGISGTSFSSPRLSTQLKIRNGLSDIDMSGFITNKGHLGPTDFKGITGDPGTMQYSMNTDNPGSTYAWTRMMYNDKIKSAYNNIEDVKSTGFVTNKIHNDISDFIGIDGNQYNYPTDPAPHGSYAFNNIKMGDITVGGKQQYKIFGNTGPYGDSNIDAKQHRYSNNSNNDIKLSGKWKDRVNNLYVSIPGKGETNLRKESSNFHSWGNATDQPFILRDIGENWSLFSDGPGPKFGIDLIRGGVGTAINRSLWDVLRIGKFLISPKGLLFIAKNVGLQLTNPKMQMDSILGIGANRIYPLGLSTLAQTLTNAVGIHLIRHGLGPLNGTLPNNARYEDNVYHSFGSVGGGGGAKKAAKEAGLEVPDTSAMTGDVPKLPDLDTGTPMGAGNERSKSRLVFLATDMQSGLWGAEASDQSLKPASIISGLQNTISSAVPAAIRGMSKVKITRLSDKGFLGPHSVYGIGGTTIYRSSAGIGISQHEQTGGTFADSKYLSKSGRDMIFNQKEGERVTDNPSVAKIYNTSEEGKKYSDQYGGSTSGKDNYSAEGSTSDAYDRMTDLADTNPYKSRQAIKVLGNDEAGIAKPDQETFILDNEEYYNDMSDFGFESEKFKGLRVWNRHDKYSSKIGQGTFDEMLGDFSTGAVEANDESTSEDEEGTKEPGGGGTFQSPLTQRFANETNEGIGAPDKLAKLHGDNESPSDFNVSQNMRLRKYESITYGKVDPTRTTQKLMDFREHLGESNQNFHRPNGGDPEAAPWEGKDRVSRFGADYGTMYSPDGGGIVQRGIRSNLLGLEDASVDMTDPESPEYKAEFDDLIRVKFSSITPKAETAETLQFRAYMTNLSDQISPSWQEVTYVGRTTPLYLFESMGRAISFDLQLVAGTKSELVANYKRLNRFMQLISPEYKSGLPVAPMLKITLGDWFIDTPIIIDSFDLSPNSDSPWEIDEGKQLPFYLDLSIGGKILFADTKTGEDKVSQTIYSRNANYFGAITQNFKPAGIYSPTE
jgi:hypothetical protein